MNNFDLIRNDGRLLYEFIRGSQLYGLNTPNSDTDMGGVFLSTPSELFSLNKYISQVSDEKHDTVWFEIGELISLLLKSNPTVLESLFVPQNKIVGTVHPLMQMILDNRDAFVTKECFNPFFGYAKSQIAKARGLNKKIVNPMEKLLSPYDFIYTFLGQGSTKIKDWLANHGLKQEYCGLVNIPNMRDVYGVYYDWGMHIKNEKCIVNGLWEGNSEFTNFMQKEISKRYGHGMTVREIMDGWDAHVIKPIGYRGIVGDKEDDFEPRLSSIDDKDDKPICYISYNKDGYACHCKKWKEQKEWEKERNPMRYESNLDKTYDSKNMMHCFRLIHMAKEIAMGRGVILERTEDKEFLLDIRNHKYEYDTIMKLLETETQEMNTLMAKSTITECVDVNFANDLLLKIRQKQLELI